MEKPHDSLSVVLLGFAAPYSTASTLVPPLVSRWMEDVAEVGVILCFQQRSVVVCVAFNGN